MLIKRILSVDDNETDQYVHARRIRAHDADIELRAAHDGEEGLEVLRSGDFWPDLVFLDVNMPRLDGFGFLEGCRQEFADRPLNVILTLTSAFQECDEDRAKDFPVVRGTMIKPLKSDWPELVLPLIKGVAAAGD